MTLNENAAVARNSSFMSLASYSTSYTYQAVGKKGGEIQDTNSIRKLSYAREKLTAFQEGYIICFS